MDLDVSDSTIREAINYHWRHNPIFWNNIVPASVQCEVIELCSSRRSRGELEALFLIRGMTNYGLERSHRFLYWVPPKDQIKQLPKWL